jgi:hypothetical protein
VHRKGVKSLLKLDLDPKEEATGTNCTQISNITLTSMSTMEGFSLNPQLHQNSLDCLQS